MKSDFSMASILEGSSGSPKKSPDTSPKTEVSSNPGSPDLENRETSGESRECVRVMLDDVDLWRSFHQLTNEMIVTKNGSGIANELQNSSNDNRIREPKNLIKVFESFTKLM
eukprot:gene6162-11557_t